MDIHTVSLNYLAEKALSEKELKTYLENHFTSIESQPEIDKTISQLKSEGIIDDLRLAKQLTFHYSHKGDLFIQKLLKQREIAGQVVNQVLSSLENETERAHREVKTRLNDLELTKKSLSHVHQFLKGRQFSQATIFQIINNILDEKFTLRREQVA